MWHLAVQGLPGSGVCYALRVSGNGGWDTGYRWDKSRLLLDPRAPLVAGRKAWARRDDFEEFQQNVRLRVCVLGDKRERGSKWVCLVVRRRVRRCQGGAADAWAYCAPACRLTVLVDRLTLL